MAQQAARGQYPPEQLVHAWVGDHPAITRSLTKKLNEAIAETANPIVNGAASDWADYRERVGFVAGLRRALEMAAEAEKEMRG